MCRYLSSPLKKRTKLFNAAVQGTLTLSTKALTGFCRFYSCVYVAEISLEHFSWQQGWVSLERREVFSGNCCSHQKCTTAAPPHTPTPFHAAGTGGDLQMQNALSPARGEISHPVGKLVVFRQVCFGIPSSAACPSPFYWCLRISQ